MRDDGQTSFTDEGNGHNPVVVIIDISDSTTAVTPAPEAITSQH
jgi:hypothetical protein